MNIMSVRVEDIKVNQSNPRDIQRKKFQQLVNSLLVFPRMLDIRPIVVDETMTALGGNQRARALQHILSLTFPDVKRMLATLTDFKRYNDVQRQATLDYWESFFNRPVVGVIDAATLSEAERDQFIIKDNANYGAWDWNKLANEWDALKLNEWGLDIWGADDAYGSGETQEDTTGQQEDESPKDGSESKKKKQTTICITINDESQYEAIVASVELAVADYDVTIK